jgi:ssDNA-binding Zn-finger/Zn-ribbon topoisomerase 1
MECLHGLPASTVSTKNGKFWLCNKNNPNCPEQDRSLYETAMATWRANGPIHPVCDTHQRLARMKVVKDVSKLNFGRPFFVCCDRENPCNFWQWSDRHELQKPKYGHGLNACVRKVKKKVKIKAAFSSVAQTIQKSRAVFLNGNSSWNTRSTKCIFLTSKELVYCRVIQRYTRTW